MTPLRIGVSGVGRAFRRLYGPALARSPGLVLIAAADPDPGRRALAGVLPFEGTAPMIASGAIDALVVLSPPAHHAGDALAAMAAGLPVLVEKPICRSRVELAELEQAGRALLTPAFTRRFWPAYRRLRAAGPPDRELTLGIRTAPADWEAFVPGSDAIDDLAPHAIDLARWICRDEVSSVVASETAGILRLTLRMHRGLAVRCRLGHDGPYREAARIDGRTTHIGPTGRLRSAAGRLGSGLDPAVAATADLLAAWAAAIAGARPPDLPNFADGAATVESLAALRGSLESAG